MTPREQDPFPRGREILARRLRSLCTQFLGADYGEIDLLIDALILGMAESTSSLVFAASAVEELIDEQRNEWVREMAQGGSSNLEPS